MNYNDPYFNIPKTRKVKHVKFFMRGVLSNLENDVNGFVDAHPEYKILGVRLSVQNNNPAVFIATVTYLEDAKNATTEDYEDDADEERDSD